MLNGLSAPLLDALKPETLGQVLWKFLSAHGFQERPQTPHARIQAVEGSIILLTVPLGGFTQARRLPPPFWGPRPVNQ